jgi:transcriptional regulator GlxA family with amidase domain
MMNARAVCSKRILIVGFPDVELLDVAGPAEVFATASDFLRQKSPGEPFAYSIELCAPRRGNLATSCGLSLFAQKSIREVRGTLDTLIIAGGRGVRQAMRNAALIAWVGKMSKRTRRLCSVCAGAFVLAETGLLRRRRVTTHWRLCDEFAARYPDILIERDPIFVRDGNVFTSAGDTAGLDLALGLVEQDHGRELALAIARELVMFLKRPGGQSQFSAHLRGQVTSREPIRDLQAWIPDELDSDLSVEALARRAAMSPRNFSRVFKRETEMTPASFVELARVEHARRLLEDSTAGVEAIAAKCGFGTGESMRRAFLRTLRVPPTSYRERFRRLDVSTDGNVTVSRSEAMTT